MAKFIETSLAGVVLIEPSVYGDDRGYFFESYNRAEFHKAVGPVEFVQDNQSGSERGVLRGLHYQLPPFAQAKLVRVLAGLVHDVVLDIRPGSSTFGKHQAFELSEDNRRQLFIPAGFAHGFLVLSAKAVFAYKVDQYYSPEHDRGIKYDDPSLGIDWPICSDQLVLSEKDRRLPVLGDAELPPSGGKS